MKLTLEKANWIIGNPLPGADVAGFATVYEAKNSSEEPFVAKFVKKEAGAGREKLINDSLSAAGATAVIPVIDHGAFEDNLVLIMPRAEKSLARHLGNSASPLPLQEALDILIDIATALEEIDEEVVHRDLKPQNVLLHDGRWCLADFGIARYAADSTAVETRKHSFTRQYAAPEQWELKHATRAADVYSFGIMAYELITGSRPFLGPTPEDYRRQHLEQPAPALSGSPSRLRALVEECLYKTPEQRPKPSNLLARLKKAHEQPASPGLTRLAAANQTIVTERVKLQTEEQSEARQKQTLDQMYADACRGFELLWEPLHQAIEDEAPTAAISLAGSEKKYLATTPDGAKMLHVPSSAPLKATMSGAMLQVSRPLKCEQWDGPFTVVAHADISVRRAVSDLDGWRGRSHSLWYCDAYAEGHFQWFEMAFMRGVLGRTTSDVVPYSSDPRGGEEAFLGGVGSTQLAWLSVIDRDDPSEFVDRWLGWLADAVEAKLHVPSTLPEKAVPRNWRSR